MVSRILLSIFLASGALLAVGLPTGTGCNVSGLSNASPPVLTCAVGPGWTDGTQIRTVNIVVGTSWFTPDTSYVKRLTSTTFELYTNIGLTSPVAAPGAAFNHHDSVKWAIALEDHAISTRRPRLYKRSWIENLRRTVARGTLTNIVVSGGTATATLADLTNAPNVWQVGGGVGVWGSATSALNTASATVTAVGASTISWTTAAANGTYTDAAVSAWAHTQNVGWRAVSEQCAAYTFYNVWRNNDGYPNMYHACALVHYVDRTNTTARDRALWLLTNFPQQAVYGSLSCDESTEDYCGGRDNGVDYSRGFMPYLARIYDLLKEAGAVDSTTETTFLNMVLNDRPSCTNPGDSWTAATGTISASGTTVTGVGTNFTSFAVGGMIWNHQGYRQEENSWIITAIASDTSMTISNSASFSGLAPATDQVTGNGWSYSRPWQTGDCGLVWFGRHHNLHTVSNKVIYPATSNEYTSEWYAQNLVVTGAWGEIGTSLALYGDDARADKIFLDNLALVLPYQMATIQTVGGESTPMAETYGFGGRGIYLPSIADWIASAAPTYTSRQGPWQAGILPPAIWGYQGAVNPDLAQFTFTGEGALGKNALQVAQATEMSQWLPDDTLRKAWQQQVVRYCGAASVAALDYACFGYNGYSGVDQFFMGWNPHLVPSPVTLSSLPKGRVNSVIPMASCEGIACSPAGTMGEGVSRWDWTQSPVRNWYFCWGPSVNDHHTPCQGNRYLRLGVSSSSTAGSLTPFLGADNPGYRNTGAPSYNPENGSFLVPGTSNWRKTFVTNAGTAIAPLAYSGVTDDVFWIGIDHANAFGTPLTTARRSTVRFTNSSGKDITIEDMHAVQPSAGLLRDLLHFYPNGQSNEGATTCAGSACSVGPISGKLHSESQGWRLMVDTVFPDGGGVRLIEQANGAYTGGTGDTFRLTTCASTDATTCSATATSLRAVTAYYIGPDTDGTSMTTTARTAGSTWRGATVVANGDTATAMFSTTAQTSMAAVSLPAGKFFAVGLSPGTYDVRVDGAVVADNVTVTSTGGALYVASHGAGAVDIVQDGAPPDPIDIATSSLPDGTEDVSYSQALSISGGTPAYACTVTVGALPTGLTLSSTGTISGTPTTAGSSSFTISCTDSLAATPDTAALSITIGAASGGGGGSATGGVRGAARAIGGATIK